MGGMKGEAQFRGNLLYKKCYLTHLYSSVIRIFIFKASFRFIGRMVVNICVSLNDMRYSKVNLLGKMNFVNVIEPLFEP